MKYTILLVTSLLSFSAMAGWRTDTRKILKKYSRECKQTEVSIDSIVRNESIEGHIRGLPQDAYDKFKVVFYVKTNLWYIHPYSHYEGQDEGYSYSKIDENGNFKVKTVLRQIPSKELAAVLVPHTYKIKSRKWTLNPLLGFIGGVLKYDCSYTTVKGNGDF